MGEISWIDAKRDQKLFEKDLGEAKKGNSKKKSNEQKKNTLYNIDMLGNSRKEVIKIFDDYSSMVSQAKNRATKGTGVKILRPKQMLKRLPIALARVKVVISQNVY